MKMLRICCFALLSYTSLLSAISEKLPLQQIMSEDEMKQMGLDAATPEQQQAFERWVATWTKRVIEQAPSYRPGENISVWVQQWPGYANPAKTEFSEEEFAQRQKANQVVNKIRNDGEYIELKDGSIWQISPVFRYLSTTWQRDQVIEIKKSENERHPYILHNITTDQVVQANISQPPSPTGQSNQEGPDYFKGSFNISATSEQGDVVALNNGSSWKIAPRDMYRTNSWKPNDRIKLKKTNDPLYQYQLENLDTGEVAQANKNP